jgi:sortase A
MRRWIGLAVCALAACGNDAADMSATFSAATTVVATTSPSSSSTLPPTTTTRPSTTRATTTTLAPTTTRPSLPVPEPPPVEDGTVDPLVEVGQIEIPRLALDRTIYEGVRLSTVDHGPGHWPGTALPGELGNVVLAGHRVSQNADFRNLDQLTEGDEVIFTTKRGRRHVYHVVSTEIVGPEAIRIVDQTYARTATLFACHPPGSVAQRIVVHLELV